MSKLLCLLTLLFLAQAASAHDFLRSGKQLLVCNEDNVLFRVNWEDWDIENKTFSVRTKNDHRTLVLSTLRNPDEVEDSYNLYFDHTEYDDGGGIGGRSFNVSLGEDIEEISQGRQDEGMPYNLHYVDKKATDSQVKKICQK